MGETHWELCGQRWSRPRQFSWMGLDNRRNRTPVEEAGVAAAEVGGLPKGFVPSYPGGCIFMRAASQSALDMAADLFRNVVVVGGHDTDRLAEASRRAGVWTVIGVCEKRAGTTGTLWNSAIHFAPDGRSRACIASSRRRSGDACILAATVTD